MENFENKKYEAVKMRRLISLVYEYDDITYPKLMKYLNGKGMNKYYLDTVKSDVVESIIDHFQSPSSNINKSDIIHTEDEFVYVKDSDRRRLVIDHESYFSEILGPIFPKINKKRADNDDVHFSFAKIEDCNFTESQKKSIIEFIDKKKKMLETEKASLDPENIDDKAIIPIIESFNINWLQAGNVTFLNGDENRLVLKSWGLEARYMNDYIDANFFKEDIDYTKISSDIERKIHLEDQYFLARDNIYNKYKSHPYDTNFQSQDELKEKIEDLFKNNKFNKIANDELNYYQKVIIPKLKTEIIAARVREDLESEPVYNYIFISQANKYRKIAQFTLFAVIVVLVYLNWNYTDYIWSSTTSYEQPRSVGQWPSPKTEPNYTIPVILIALSTCVLGGIGYLINHFSTKIQNLKGCNLKSFKNNSLEYINNS